MGEKIDPSQIAIVFHLFGDREVETVNLQKDKTSDEKSKKPLNEDVEVKKVVKNDTEGYKNANEDGGSDSLAKYGTIDLVSGGRLPAISTGMKIILFPRGLQVYRFTEKYSVESPINQELVAGAYDGDIETDFIVHVHVLDDEPDIKQRFISLIRHYNLLKYSGDDDVLVSFIRDGRFFNLLKDRFTNYVSPKKVLDVITDKAAMNKEIIDYMNAEFNPFGLKFTLCSVSSAIRVDDAQRKKMAEVVQREIKMEKARLTNQKINPLLIKINKVNVSALEEANTIVTEAHAKAMAIEEEAIRQRIDTIVALIGPENYHILEKTIRVSSALAESNTKIRVIPKDTTLIVDSRLTGKAAGTIEINK